VPNTLRSVAEFIALAAIVMVHLDIQSFLADPKLGPIWTEESPRRTSICRNEWEHDTVIATAGEA